MNYSSSFERMLKYLHKRNDCRISNLLTNCHHFLTDDFCNYITTRGEMLSYLPAGKEHKVNDDGKWSRDGRQEAKPAKLVKKIILPDIVSDLMINDKEFEQFANNVKAYVLTNGDGDNDRAETIDIVIANGAFIDAYYDKNNYADVPDSNLSGSCMRSMEDGTFDLYTKNPDKVSIVVAINKLNQVMGRALLWKTNELGYCMDTIYAPDKVRAVMINFAREHGFHYKSAQSCHWNSFDMFDGNNVGFKYVTVSLRNTCFDYYPYLDTLSYLCLSNDMLRNGGWDGEHRVLRCTDGDYETANQSMYDDWTGFDINEDDARHADYRLPNGNRFCGHTHYDNLCDVDHYGYVLTEHAEYSTDLRQWVVNDSDYWIYSDRDVRWYESDDCVIDHNGDVIDCDDAVMLANGDMAHFDDAVELADGTWELESDCVKVDDVWVLQSSINNDNQ